MIDYQYSTPEPDHSHAYLLPVLDRELKGPRVFDLGCGNGSVAGHIAKRGFKVSGVDVSCSGIHQANAALPHLDLRVGSAYDDLATTFGRFSCVVSLEVVEHLYDPRLFAKNIFNLLDEGGVAIISTPYHGYLKNLVLAATNKLDTHFTALWDNGHIKFWSIRTLSTLLTESGFREIAFYRVGRIPWLAKSMIAIARRT